jgi:hypothetical protein
LYLVAYQLELFDHRPLPNADNGGMENDERDKRTGLQWLKAILAYLEFGTGDGWRRLTDRGQRWHPDRLWYLNGIATIHDVMGGRVPASNPFIDKKLPQPVRHATPGHRREDRCA